MTVTKPLFIAAAVAVALAAPAQAEFKRIKTEAEFQNLIVGKKLVGPRGHFLLRADGKSTGKVGDQKWIGAWLWSKNAYCSNGRLGNNPEIGTKCHFWEVDGNQARLLRDRGKGDVTVYVIE